MKQPWYKNISIANVGKGVAYILTALGLGVGATSVTGFTDSKADEIGNKFAIHEVTDSLRNVYMERRMVEMQKDIDILVTLSKDSHEAIIRMEAKAAK